MELYEKKPRGKKGEGRVAIFKPINLPVDVLADLKLLKSLYEIALSKEKDKGGSPIPVKITYGQMLVHWMNNLKKIDPSIDLPGEPPGRPDRGRCMGDAVFLHE